MNLVKKYKLKCFKDLHKGNFITIIGFTPYTYEGLKHKVSLGSQYQITDITICYFCQFNDNNEEQYMECPSNNRRIEVKNPTDLGSLACCFFALGDEYGRPLLKNLV